VRAVPVRGETVVILGGGMTAAQLACATLEHGAAQVGVANCLRGMILCLRLAWSTFPSMVRVHTFVRERAGSVGLAPHIQEARIRGGSDVLREQGAL
jgi:cation diffusion facilitator CzcD-associated flavoprotein CzcO